MPHNVRAIDYANQHAGVLTRSQAKVLLALAQHANDQGQAALSYRALTAATGLSTEAVRLALLWLSTQGLIHRERRTDPQYGLIPTCYTLVACVPSTALATREQHRVKVS